MNEPMTPARDADQRQAMPTGLEHGSVEWVLEFCLNTANFSASDRFRYAPEVSDIRCRVSSHDALLAACQAMVREFTNSHMDRLDGVLTAGCQRQLDAIKLGRAALASAAPPATQERTTP